jgi:hypothetical protein
MEQERRAKGLRPRVGFSIENSQAKLDRLLAAELVREDRIAPTEGEIRNLIAPADETVSKDPPTLSLGGDFRVPSGGVREIENPKGGFMPGPMLDNAADGATNPLETKDPSRFDGLRGEGPPVGFFVVGLAFLALVGSASRS